MARVRPLSRNSPTGQSRRFPPLTAVDTVTGRRGRSRGVVVSERFQRSDAPPVAVEASAMARIYHIANPLGNGLVADHAVWGLVTLHRSFDGLIAPCAPLRHGARKSAAPPPPQEDGGGEENRRRGYCPPLRLFAGGWQTALLRADGGAQSHVKPSESVCGDTSRVSAKIASRVQGRQAGFGCGSFHGDGLAVRHAVDGARHRALPAIPGDNFQRFPSHR
jgi:hypothetical protein